MGLRLCYLVACRVLEMLGSRRRTALDKDIELMVLRQEVRVLKRQLRAACATDPQTERSLLRSAEYFQGGAGGAFSSRPRLCFAGTGSSRVASGSVGEPSEALDVPRSAMRSSSSSSDSAGRTAAGDVSHSGRASRARGPHLGELDPPGP